MELKSSRTLYKESILNYQECENKTRGSWDKIIGIVDLNRTL